MCVSRLTSVKSGFGMKLFQEVKGSKASCSDSVTGLGVVEVGKLFGSCGQGTPFEGSEVNQLTGRVHKNRRRTSCTRSEARGSRIPPAGRPGSVSGCEIIVDTYGLVEELKRSDHRPVLWLLEF